MDNDVSRPRHNPSSINHHHHHHHHYHHHLALPAITSLLRLLPLTLLFFLTTPHTLAEHIHAIYTRRPYLKPSPLDPFPSQHGDVNIDALPLKLHESSQRHSIILPARNSFYVSLRPPAECTQRRPCSALLEAWYDASLPRELKPDPYLLAANGDVPQPFPRFPAERLADDEAFFTWRPYHYLQLSRIVASDRWHMRILNLDTTVFNVLNASFRITVEPVDVRVNQKPGAHADKANANPGLCPSGPGNSPCSAHGQCVTGGCHCSHSYGGRYCETNLTYLPTGAFDVAPDAMRVFRFVAPRYGNVATVLKLHSPDVVSPAAHPILFAKRLGANGGRQLRTGPPLPSIYDLRFTDVAAVHASLREQHVITGNMREGEVLYIGVYNFHVTPPVWLARRHRALRGGGSKRNRVRVEVTAFACAERSGRRVGDNIVLDVDGLRVCPTRSAQTWEVGLRVLLGPLVLGSLTLMTMVVCVSVWAGVFRQQMLDTMTSNLENSAMNHATTLGFVGYDHPRRDKLSEKEVNAMFPAFEFSKIERDALCAVGDASCSVCLCSFEEKEMLRRLACGHSYHSECLDRWLLTNATCPRCRKSARIRVERLASGGVVLLRRAVRWGIARIHGTAGWLWALGRRERVVQNGQQRNMDTIDIDERHDLEHQSLALETENGTSHGNDDPTDQV